MTTPIRVFCSHSSIDKPRVKEVAARLAAAGIDPWVDDWEIAPGDDIVARIDEGLAACQVGLIFFSKTTMEKAWVRGEVSNLTYQAIEDGKAVIPVMLDPDAPVPQLLRPRARVAGEDLNRLIDAIYGRSGKPRVAPARTSAQGCVFRARLEEPQPGTVRASAVLGGEIRVEEVAALGPQLDRTYRQFLESSLPGASRMSAREAAQQRERDLVRLGEALGSALLPGAVGRELATALDRTAAAGETLQLEFEATPDLLVLPFEAARLPDGRLPALEPGVQVLRRQIGLAREPVEPLPGPLRILVTVGAPDEGATGNAVLDYERELQTILDAIDHARQYGNAEVKILEVGHPDQIRRALLERSYHVLHISGHGRAGIIELEDEDGRAVTVTPQELAAAVRAGARRPPLIFLASCLSGAADSDTTGFAQGLLAQGMPLVLAMQSSVSDWYATRLAGAFYEHLSRMETPLAGLALAHARREVEQERRAALARGDRHPGLVAEYATPALFAASEERALVDYALPKEEPTLAPELPAVGQMPMLRMDDLIGRRPALRRVAGVLRDDPRVTKETGPHAGVLIGGIGGVGKSALAGRVMARLAEDGWTVIAAVGRWGLGELALALGGQLALLEDPKLAHIGDRLLTAELPDQVRLQQLQTLLANSRVLLVLDNFEDNLTLGGKDFLDETTGFLLAALLQAARQGKVLITCRYPVPGIANWLFAEPLGPLSPAETRKLFYRLPALTGEAPETLSLILRHIGGHPRMLEYLDAILRKGAARLPAVAARLRENARRLGLDPEALGGDLNASLRDALRLGAEDVLLEQLIELVAREPADLAALHQAAAFALPVDLHGLAFTLAEGGPQAEQVAALEASVRRLIGTSLLTPMPRGLLWVHRWTAQELRARMPEAQARECARRAGEYRAWRVVHVSHDLTDGIEATRRFLEAAAFDRALDMARPILDFMQRYGQLVDVAAFTGEIMESLPSAHQGYCIICATEADALKALGATDRAMARYREAMEITERLARAEPQRADFQWDLVVSLWHMADLAEDGGTDHLERALGILHRLDAAGGLYPEQREGIARFEERLRQARA